MYKHLFRATLGLIGIMGILSLGVVNAQSEPSKDIVIEATATEANQTLKINKYFANAYTVSRCDGCETSTLSSDTGHTYEEPGTYTITLSLTGGATRWTFQSSAYNKPLVPQDGTTMTGVKIVYMPSLASGFGYNMTSPGNYFFYSFNNKGALTSLPDGSFDTSNITSVSNYFFVSFNSNGSLESLPEGSFDTSNITTAGSSFFSHFNSNGKLTSLPERSFNISKFTTADGSFFSNFNYSGSLTSLPEGSFDTSKITTVGNYFFENFNYNGSLESLPEGSFDTSKITTVGNNFFENFNSNGSLESLPEGSFDISKITTLGEDFFCYFNGGGALRSLPKGSFDTSNITTVSDYFFQSFNENGSLESLPEGSFDTSNITGENYAYAGFSYFNRNGKITYLPDSFTLNSKLASEDGYYRAFNSPNYTLNRNVSDLVSGISVSPDIYYSNHVFSDNQPGRCGVHKFWLVTPISTCDLTVTFNANGGDEVSPISANDGGKIILPKATREGYRLIGWYESGYENNIMIAGSLYTVTVNKTLYAKWMDLKSIVLEATATAADRTLKINKYFSNAYTVDRGDGNIQDLTGNTTHPYTTAGTYTIILSLSGGATRWKFKEEGNTLIPVNGTTMTGVKIVYMPSLADGFGDGVTSVGHYFFRNFNRDGALTSLPEGSFDTSQIKGAGNATFSHFNSNGALTSLPEGSFDLSNLTTAGIYSFNSFNGGGKITELPDSFTLTPAGVLSTGYGSAFNSPNYTLNKKVSDLVAGITPPNGDRDTFSDNQPGRCGVHKNWLVTKANACHIVYDANGGIGTTTGGYDSDSTGVIVGLNITLPTRNGYTISGWKDASGNNIEEVIFPEMDDQTFYAQWTINEYFINYELHEGVISGENVTGYTVESEDITLINPTKTGHTFIGRSGTDIEGITGNVTIPTGSTGDRNYEANWIVNEYAITFVDGSGENVSIVYSGDYESAVDTQYPKWTKDGYTISWDKEIPATMPLNGDTITASWTENEKPSGGSSGGGGSKNKTDTDTQKEDKTPIDSSAEPQNDNTASSGANAKDPLSVTPIDSSAEASEGQQFTDEFQEAFEFAKGNGITTMPTIQSAKMDGKLTRIAMAKMLSYYAINVLGQKPDETRNNKFKDITDKMDKDYDDGVTLAYQLGIMGINMPNNKFRPNDEVPRAEFATALSRMLYNTSDGEYKSTPKYYIHHMEKLVKEGIITKSDPAMKELRGYVMIMLMRSSK